MRLVVAQLLTTKLFIPAPRPGFVSRTRLVERLDECLRQNSGVVLLSAPAGFGKTTLISVWIANCARPAGWLSLDEEDDDSTRFLTYLIAALQTISPDIGAGALVALQSPQPPPTESILTALINEIANSPRNVILVLDDYHVIDSKPVNAAIAFFLDHLPPAMHLIIATREDPDLPLARLRAQGQLTELRAADLRFTTSEAAEFLNHEMGLNLTAEDITALEARTEGWIAGLQLAAISMRGNIDLTNFIQTFTGSHRFVMDYLVEEVLGQQSKNVQNFLLKTSILGRMCGQLCDAVLSTPSSSGQVTLEYLDRSNLFIIPLDSERRWFRYHHLFADVLQARLMKEHPDQVAALHMRASIWYEENRYRSDAIYHALAAEDFERAADLIELERSADRGTFFRNATWLGWVKALPDELVRSRPRLSIGCAWECLNSGLLEAAESRIKDVERVLGAMDGSLETLTGSGVAENENNGESQSLQASLALARAYHAQALGNTSDSEKYARQVLTLVPESNHFMRGFANAQLGLVCWANGHLETAFTYMAEAMASLRTAGAILYANSGMFVLAQIRIAQGRLLDSIHIYEQALRKMSIEGAPVLQGTADLYLRLSEVFFEQGDQEGSREYLQKSEALGKNASLDEWPYRFHLFKARIQEAEGDLEGALQLLDEAERLYQRSPVPDVHPLAALKARLWIRLGRLKQAVGWSEMRRLSVDDELNYMREFELVTLARLLLSLYLDGHSDRTIHEALGLLGRLLKAAEDGGRLGSVLEILIVQALAHRSRGDNSLALALLERALSLAEPEGYFRLFIVEGELMLDLLKQVKTESGKVMMYARRLITGFEKTESNLAVNGDQHLLNPLSERELEVLRLIAQGLSNDEISSRLFVALDTVKGHNRRIFEKLGVRRRTEAVARARKLGLL